MCVSGNFFPFTVSTPVTVPSLGTDLRDAAQRGTAMAAANNRAKSRMDDMCISLGIFGPRTRRFRHCRYNSRMQASLALVRHILDHGARKSDRTGTGTLSVFGEQLRQDLGAGFPLLTTKKLHLRSIIYELLWFLRGDTNVRYLNENKVTIWDEWADANGDLGPIYGYQWRSWPAADGRHIDQISKVLADIKRDPDSRRHIVSAWNVGDIDQMEIGRGA